MGSLLIPELRCSLRREERLQDFLALICRESIQRGPAQFVETAAEAFHDLQRSVGMHFQGGGGSLDSSEGRMSCATNG